jgi:DNA (cytosine-5)-methyltransferase 1
LVACQPTWQFLVFYKLRQKKPIRVFEAFAGYGGASFGLQKAKIPFEVVGYSEIDKDAIELYDYNFPDIYNFGDITQIDERRLPDFDLFTGGFPCQPFSTVGSRLGELDTRGTLFSDIIRICEYKKPKYILLENVKGLCVGKHKPTFLKIVSELQRIGYDVRYDRLNSKDYGVPQTRERLWIFAYRGTLPTDFDITPPTIELKHRLKDFLDPNPEEELYRTQKQIDRIKELHNIPLFDVEEPLCYDYYNRRLRKDALCMTVTPPEHNVIRIVEPLKNGKERLRKLSTDEHFRLMGFVLNADFREIKYPPTLGYTKLGRRAGNGWDVNLVAILFKHIFSQI